MSVFLVGARGIEHDAGVAGVDDEGDAVVLGELIDEQLERLLDQRQPFSAHHRAGDVDEEDEVAGGALVAVRSASP